MKLLSAAFQIIGEAFSSGQRGAVVELLIWSRHALILCPFFSSNNLENSNWYVHSHGIVADQPCVDQDGSLPSYRPRPRWCFHTSLKEEEKECKLSHSGKGKQGQQDKLDTVSYVSNKHWLHSVHKLTERQSSLTRRHDREISSVA